MTLEPPRSLKVWKLPVLMALPGTRYSGPLESEALTQWIRDISDISRLEVLPPASEQMSLCPAFELYEEPRVAREFLAAHNIYRCTAGIAMLEWDLPLFHSARRYADRAPLDRLAHSDPRERKGKHGVYGENVAIGEHLWPGQVVARWHDEIRNTQDGVFRPKRAGLGHYTQLVWRKTLRLGCSLGQNRRVAVCHYDPAGNEKGRHLSQVGAELAHSVRGRIVHSFFPDEATDALISRSPERFREMNGDHFSGGCGNCCDFFPCPAKVRSFSETPLAATAQSFKVSSKSPVNLGSQQHQLL